MKGVKFALIVTLGVGALLGALGAGRSLSQEDDDVIIGQLVTMKQRRDFFRTLTPERKSALWRKHYRAELAKHPELTTEQKAVVNLAMVLASTDLFRDKLPEPCGPGSVFRNAAETAFKDSFELRREILGSLPIPCRGSRMPISRRMNICRTANAATTVGATPVGATQHAASLVANS